MDLEKAAQALVECKYSDSYVKTKIGIFVYTLGEFSEIVDPINNESQLFALAHWFLFPDKTLTLTGDGHFNVKEQLQNFVKENLK